ncbi:alpha-L-rhamnosidase-like protein [Dysgonomonas alginatilytica]|uniref:Alpha-L-rhamnosidase-like protein n=1 Tax=Dysgonomonas alginatilytica TaxID=1605892 RepID=A0A2V3PKL0_9BACT|nr:glycosyl hydrolase [Dysgonomonas alginatilytica]PXV59955.1 alpha-L-rhamnosidase-like protein [Dysgonomonas alginatilytica]
MKNICLIISLFLSVYIIAQEQRFKGYPSLNNNMNLEADFAHPPKGYGNVPFYWWNGDSLNRERLAAQLDILRNAPIDGFAVSYIHSNPKVDKELNKNGYGRFGRTDPGRPEVFTDKWWDIWNWFSGQCASYGIGLGLDDYTLGWVGNGYWTDEIVKEKSFQDYQGKLKIETISVKRGETIRVLLTDNLLQIVAFPEAKTLKSNVRNKELVWQAPTDKDCKVYIIRTGSAYELHPDYGKRVVETYFENFTRHLDEKAQKGMNYFFQDELDYPLTMLSWSEDLPQEFQKRKGYDILPYLPALVDDIGDITPKIRLDYAEVLTQLAEERYFKPIFDWHEKRGLIYGCDNNGRGLEPIEYVDYFRMTSWFTAPGNDAPARGSSFPQTKVSSSISHLYKRPRTWLEAFHSMGWDSNGEWLTKQLDHHLLAGGNLVCMHGLYYSTHGGWWEWAPPCFHFRMPYWPHMKKWLEYSERLSFLLSQGTHVCDIAVMYPTETLQAYPNADTKGMWDLVDSLSIRGLDYDFIDYQSLQKADIQDSQLSVSGEKYKILILADMKALHHNTLLKVLDFHRKGGIVVATGALPVATSKSGANDPEIKKILDEIFNTSSLERRQSFFEPDMNKLLSMIPKLIVRDFIPQNGKGRVLHRRIGEKDVYMVADVAKDSEIFFRSKGKVERWIGESGAIVEQPILRQTEDGTWVRFDGEENNSRLIVFSPGSPVYENVSNNKIQKKTVQSIEGNWDIDIIPTMQNKWGDYRLPASDAYIGAEARDFSYKLVSSQSIGTSAPLFDATSPKGVYGYAPYMETQTLPATLNLNEYLSSEDNLIKGNWKPYCFSWQYGVFDSPGSQGYHGLKGKVDNRFIILDQGGHQLFRTYAYADKKGWYKIEQEGTAPDFISIGNKPVNDKRIYLSEGWHPLVIAYANTPKEEYNLEDKKSYSWDDRKRSALVLYPEEYPALSTTSPYDHIISTKWYNTGYLPFDPYAGTNGNWYYQFETAPGTKELVMTIKGTLTQLWIDEKESDRNQIQKMGQDGIYRIKLNKKNSGISTVTLLAKPDRGFIGPALFSKPVELTCENGQMPLGDWSQFGALKYYSGGMLYKKKIVITEDLYRKNAILNLGGVDATCEVKINGKEAGVLISPPYQLDITNLVKKGENVIEVLIYSTLSNHYQDIPSAYRGVPRAGLLGPVALEWLYLPK